MGGQSKVVALQNTGQNYKTTISTTPTLRKRPLYNCLQVLLLHTAAVTKDWGQAQLGWVQCPMQRKKYRACWRLEANLKKPND